MHQNECRRGCHQQFLHRSTERGQQGTKDDILIVMDDFNVRMGSREKMDYSVMGMYEFGQSNDRVELLLDFCYTNDLYISNTNFRHATPSRFWTRECTGKCT